MDLKFQVQTKIQKPIDEVFDAVYNPEKLSGYFTNGGASAPLDEGTEVEWRFADNPDEDPISSARDGKTGDPERTDRYRMGSR